MASRNLPAVRIPQLRVFQVKAVVVSTSECGMILVPQHRYQSLITLLSWNFQLFSTPFEMYGFLYSSWVGSDLSEAIRMRDPAASAICLVWNAFDQRH
jgi:hypothetical protein